MSMLAIGLALVAGLAGAPAEGVPPIGLPACGEAQDVGGWELRDFVATGTRSTDPAPVRLRNVRLSEPCYVYEPVTGLGLLNVPMRATDIPAPMLDNDHDDKDDGEPAPPPGGDFGPTVYHDGRSITYAGAVMTNTPSQQPWRWFLCFRIVGPRTDSINYASADWGWGTGALQDGASVQTLCAAEFGSSTNYVYQSIDNRVTPLGPPVRYGFRSVATGTWVAQEDYVPQTIGDDYYGGTQAATFVPGAGASIVPSGENTVIYCATSYSGEPTITYEWDSSEPWVASYLFESDSEFDSLGPPRVKDGVATGWSSMGHVGITDATFTSASCPYLVRIDLWVCVYVAHGPNDFGCTETTWTAEKYRQHGWYEDNGGPLGQICTLYPDDPQCYDVLNPPYIDGTSWDATCGKNFPALEWGAWGWVPDVVKHLSKCLFVPVNGFDRLGWIRSAFEASALGDVSSIVTAGQNSFAFSPSCGPLVDDSDGPTGLNLNTCEWGDWAGQFRPIVGTVMMAGFALWALNFVVQMALGIPNKRVPNPTESKG